MKRHSNNKKKEQSPTNDPTNVAVAFEILLEEIEAEAEFINGQGKKAFTAGNLDDAEQVLSHARELEEFRTRVAVMAEEWETFTSPRESRETADEEAISKREEASRRNLGRLPRGVRTPEKEYREPILKALLELGGSGSIQETLNLVESMMKPVLKDVDYQPLSSNSNMLRWYNAAQWARQRLVDQGYLKKKSKRGTWELTTKGRRRAEKLTSQEKRST